MQKVTVFADTRQGMNKQVKEKETGQDIHVGNRPFLGKLNPLQNPLVCQPSTLQGGTQKYNVLGESNYPGKLQLSNSNSLDLGVLQVFYRKNMTYLHTYLHRVCFI